MLTVGKATRLTRFLIQAPKVYEGDVQFGAVTDTYDALGNVVEEHPIDGLDPAEVEELLPRFVGTYEQVAPAYSAKKIDGRKYYELARKGEEVPEARKEITVYSLETTSALENGRIGLRLECSSGTYVRSLAHDLGRAAGVGAHLASLRRTRVGHFDVEDAVSLEALAESDAPTDGPGWVPFDAIRLPFPEVTLDAPDAGRILHGQTVLVRGLDAEEGDWLKLLDPRSRFVAVASVSERIGRDVGVLQPRIVFS